MTRTYTVWDGEITGAADYPYDLRPDCNASAEFYMAIADDLYWESWGELQGECPQLGPEDLEGSVGSGEERPEVLPTTFTLRYPSETIQVMHCRADDRVMICSNTGEESPQGAFDGSLNALVSEWTRW